MTAVQPPAASAAPRRATVAAPLVSTESRTIAAVVGVPAGIWLFVYAVVAALYSLERIDSTRRVFEDEAVGQFASLLRSTALYGFAAPLLLGIAVLVVPRLVGSRTVALARTAMFGGWLWLAGIVMVAWAAAVDGRPGAEAASMLDLHLLGMGSIIVGLLAVALSVFTTVFASRRPDLALTDVQPAAWGAFVSSFAMLLSLPVLLGTVVYVAIDFRYGQFVFGGAEGVVGYLGWGLGAPQSYVVAALAVGILAGILPRTANSPRVLGIALQVGTALVAAAVVGSATQTVVQLDSEGTAGETIRNLVPWALYNLLPILGVLIVLAASLLAARAGLRLLGAGFAPAFLGVGMVLTGMVGHALSTIEAVGVRGTVLDEGTGLYAAYGLALVAWGGVVGLQGGRRIAVRRAVLVTGIGFVGTVLSSLPMYVAGFMDQPSWDSVDYDSSGAVALLNGASAAGHVLVALAALAAVAAVVRSKGDAA